ncbi:rab-GTPase-TBC domain-containing protein [Sporodiniella umbellata]|nr:rab-GTPase-TBC domain-containing protein [Sporodiniella umbellata]
MSMIIPPPLGLGRPSQRSKKYKLKILQNPNRARSCGFGEKDRRPIDPPPILQLFIEQPDGRLVNAIHDGEDVFRSLVQCDLYSEDRKENLNLVYNPSTTSHDDALGGTLLSFEEPQPTRSLMGALVSSAYQLNDKNDQPGIFYIFQDLSVRIGGTFCLKFMFMNLAAGLKTSVVSDPMTMSSDVTEFLFSDPFIVYSAKNFPGMTGNPYFAYCPSLTSGLDSTPLSQCFAQQGIKISIRKGRRIRRVVSNKEEEDDSKEMSALVERETLAERRGIFANPEKLKLNADFEVLQPCDQTLQRLEQENAKLPPQVSEEYLLSRLERQNILLNADPKSVCIESNRLQADFNTLRCLVSDATFSPTHENHEASIQAMLAKRPMTEIDPQHEWDFWQAIVQDYTAAATKLPHLLAAKLRWGGIPHKIRGLVWQSMAQASSLNLESLYTQLSAETSPHYERIIQRDLSRTFPQLDMFKDDGGEGQLALGRILKAYSIYDTHVGYCQGLAFLAGPLLITMPEDQAFCTFVRLMETYEMRTMFTLNMEGLHLRLHQFHQLLNETCPALGDHLASHGIQVAMFASQWYLTLFAYTFPISLVLRIYDLVFAEGAVETITRVAIAVMQKNEARLLAMDDFESLMVSLGSSQLMYQEAYASDPESVIDDAMSLSGVITRPKMTAIGQVYQNRLAQEKKQTQRAILREAPWSKATYWLDPSPQSPSESSTDSLEEVTSELVEVKLAHFELGQKHDALAAEHRQAQDRFGDLQTSQAALIEKLMALQTTLMTVRAENDRLQQDNHTLQEKNQVAKCTLADLKMENLQLETDCRQHQARAQRLEDQRREYLMPRGSFTEEVLAAHQTLFATPTLVHRPPSPTDLQQQLADSDLRCRELEKLLAEAKLKLAECGANHRSSFQPKRPVSLQVKRSSLSALMTTSSAALESTRNSVDSICSTPSQKRASVYSRLMHTLSQGSISEHRTE